MAMHSGARDGNSVPARPLAALQAAAATPQALAGVRLRLVLTDAAAVSISCFIAQAVRFGDSKATVAGGSVGYTAVSLLLTAAWLISLWSRGAYRLGQLGHGTEEFRRVLDATLRLFAGVALISFVFQLLIARGFVIIAFPLGLILLAMGRIGWRKWIVEERRAGQRNLKVLAVGDLANVQHLAEAIQRAPGSGYSIAGVCTNDFVPEKDIHYPIIGAATDAADVVRNQHFDVVAWAGSSSGSHALRELGWALEGRKTDLVVVPGLVGVAGPRIQTRPVSGVPLLYVDKPAFSGPKLILKTSIDVILAVILILISSPVQAAVWLAVRIDSRGSAIFCQERIGLNERPFTMFKFRSMTHDAPQRLALVRDDNDGSGLLYKNKKDPRITRVGAIIRRFSLDELPQLYNVLRGDMSLVGPRPPLPSEVAQYSGDVHRRLLVKPGATGLWQISGRSDLSWEEATRLDLFYVENWSVTGDLVILAKTVSAVLRKDGAY